MPRTKPPKIHCGDVIEHEPHPFIEDTNEFHCQGFVSPKRKTKPKQDPYEQLNTLWLPLAPLRLKLAALVKEGNNEYPVGEIIRIMKEILDTPA